MIYFFKIRYYLLISILGLLFACNPQSESFSGEDDGVNSVVDTPDNQNENKKQADFQKLKHLSKAMEGAKDLRNDLAWWGYQTGFNWETGGEFYDNKMFRVNLFKDSRNINVEMDFNVSQFLPFPTVYNSDFNQKEEADYLNMQISIKSNGKLIKKLDRHESLFSTGETSYSFKLNMEDIKKLKQGWNNLTLELNTELVSFFGVRSRVKPIKAKINFDYFVPEIHHTVIYFNKLILNCDEVELFLGDNDWSNGTPEAGISIFNDGFHIATKFTKNSCSHLKPSKIDLYHKNENDSIHIKIVDVDYGFNGDDVIVDTLVGLKSLENNDFIDLPLKYVESLELYCRYKGKVN